MVYPLRWIYMVYPSIHQVVYTIHIPYCWWYGWGHHMYGIYQAYTRHIPKSGFQMRAFFSESQSTTLQTGHRLGSHVIIIYYSASWFSSCKVQLGAFNQGFATMICNAWSFLRVRFGNPSLFKARRLQACHRQSWSWHRRTSIRCGVAQPGQGSTSANWELLILLMKVMFYLGYLFYL